MTTGVSLSPVTSGEATPPPAPVAAPAPVVAPPAAAPPAAAPPAAVQGNEGTPPPAVAASGVSLSAPPAASTTGDASSPFAGLSDDHKRMAEQKGWKSVEDMVKSYSSLEQKFSSTRPADAPTDVAAYDQVISKPENAQQIGYNDDFAKWFKDTCFKGKIGTEQAKLIHDEFVQYAGSASERADSMVATRVSEAATQLSKNWGSENTPRFARNLDMSMRAINNLSPDFKDALIKVGVITNVGGKDMVANATIVDALAKVGAAMYAEDTMYGSQASTVNPFDPKTADVTKQTQLFRTDKARAASYIRALSPVDQQRYASLLATLEAR